jgi:hypothetical protein
MPDSGFDQQLKMSRPTPSEGPLHRLHPLHPLPYLISYTRALARKQHFAYVQYEYEKK